MVYLQCKKLMREDNLDQKLSLQCDCLCQSFPGTKGDLNDLPGHGVTGGFLGSAEKRLGINSLEERKHQSGEEKVGPNVGSGQAVPRYDIDWQVETCVHDVIYW